MNAPQPLILIGAARSGTKLLRDLIAAHPAVDRVPYDVNYIWRLGNEDLPHDELPVERLTPALCARLRRKVAQAAGGKAPNFVEKTVGNCLRVPYVCAVFPEARFIHLVRDGLDVVESVYRQWLAPPDWTYVVRKALHYPLLDSFGYAREYATGLISKLIRPQAQAQHLWGPRYAGIYQDVARLALVEVCAIQWARCVTLAATALQRLPPEQLLTVRYESFVQDPLRHLEQVAAFAGLAAQPYRALDLSVVTPSTIGNGARRLAEAQRSLVAPHLARPTRLLAEQTIVASG
jgi:hypothetical protein